MKKTFTLLYFVLLLAGAACTRVAELQPAKDTESEDSPRLIRTRAAGTTFDSLPDPYFIENMQAIYDEFDGNIELEPTDLYVRIMPQDSTQVEMLEDMYDLCMFDHPLDLDIPEDEEYIDPTISEDEFGWLYTTVKPDFVFPEDIVYEVLRECYIPEDDEAIEVPSTTRAEAFIVDVEQEAYERLGYNVGTPTRSGGGGGQRPQGFVTVRDTVSNMDIPIMGLRVKVNSHTKIDKEVYTNSSGFYKTNKKFWQYNLKYTLVFLNKEHDFIFWVVKGAAFGRAKYKGDITKYGGNINITSGEKWHWATMYNAACEYYQMCNNNVTGITKPPGDLKILFCPKYLATAFGGSSCALMARRLYLGIGEGSLRKLLKDLVHTLGEQNLFVSDVVATVFETNGPDLIISTYDNSGNAHSYRDIYNTMNHELSHASHYNKVGDTYWEHYIEYMASSLTATDDTYGDGTEQYNGICAVGEMWGHAMGDILMCEKYNPARLGDT